MGTDCLALEYATPLYGNICSNDSIDYGVIEDLSNYELLISSLKTRMPLWGGQCHDPNLIVVKIC